MLRIFCVSSVILAAFIAPPAAAQESVGSFESLMQSLDADYDDMDSQADASPAGSPSSGSGEVIDDFEKFMDMVAREDFEALNKTITEDTSSPMAAPSEQLAETPVKTKSARINDTAQAMEQALMMPDMAPDASTIKVEDDLANATDGAASELAEDKGSDDGSMFLSFFETITGGEFVSHDDLDAPPPAEDDNTDTDAAIETDLALEQMPPGKQADYLIEHAENFDQAIDELARVLHDSAAGDGSAVPEQNEYAQIIREQALRAQKTKEAEYEELVQSLTEKIRLLEKEKQSLRGALKQRSHRVVLP